MAEFNDLFRAMGYCCAEQRVIRETLRCTLCHGWLRWGDNYYHLKEQPADTEDVVVCESCRRDADFRYKFDGYE